MQQMTTLSRSASLIQTSLPEMQLIEASRRCGATAKGNEALTYLSEYMRAQPGIDHPGLWTSMRSARFASTLCAECQAAGAPDYYFVTEAEKLLSATSAGQQTAEGYAVVHATHQLAWPATPVHCPAAGDG